MTDIKACDAPLVSVLMPSYNYASYIREAIESVRSQTFVDFELIIVDDGSTDDSWQIISEYVDLDSRVLAVRQVNQGPSAATNCALNLAKGRYITAFTSDDRCLPTRLEKQVGFLEGNLNFDVVGSFIEEIDAHGEVKISGQYSEWFNKYLSINDPDSWVWKNLLASPTLTFRKSFFSTYGNYDPKLIYTQDWELWIRALSQGCKIHVIQEPLLQYRSHGSNLTHGDPLKTYFEYSYISSKRLNPWLVKLGRQDLIVENVLGFVKNSSYFDVKSTQSGVLLQMLFSEYNKSFSEYFDELSLGDCGRSEINSNFSTNFVLFIDFVESKISEQKLLQLELNTARSERDTAQSERDAALLKRDAALADLHNVHVSRSWRLTEPLRLGISAGRSLGQVGFRLVQFAHRLLTLKKLATVFRLLIHGDLRGIQSAIINFLRNESKRSTKIRALECISPSPLNIGQPLVSVVIPCFNYGNFVVAAIESVLAQTLNNVEVIVVDGGSTDSDTLEILKTIKKDRTRILFRDGRHLVGDNRNYGIELASGRYICCLDADDTLDFTYLEKAVFYLETYGYDIVSTAINYVGARVGQVDIMECPTLTDLVDGNHVLTCAVFRKQLWEAVGGYVDVGIGKHHVAEDWDFWLRLAANGARIRNISGEYLFNYRIHEGGSLSSSADVKSLLEQRKEILTSNQEVLTPMVFKFSEDQQSRYLRCEPTQTALSSCFYTNDHKMTLLLAMPYFLVGGAERLLSGLCEYLANHGWRVIVITTLPQELDHGTSIDWFKASTSEVYSLPSFLKLEEREDFVAYLLASRRVDCLLNTGSRLIYELIPSLKKSNPCLSIVDFLFNKVGHVDSHLQFKDFFSFALAENQEVFDWYINIAGWSTECLAKVTSGVDLRRLSPGTRRKALVDQYCIDPTELVVGFSGRLSEEKGPDVFVEVARMCRECKNLRFVMTGAGPMTELIMKKVQELPIGTRFEFAGLVDDVDQYLALYDILILPSRFDGRPLVVMEALACGVPVIASDVGGLADLVSDGINGYLVPPADARTIADRIVRLAENRPLLATMKAGARKLAEEKLDANIAYQNFEASLLRAINSCVEVN